MSFGIKDNSFMMLEDYAINFLHGCWNYCLMKTDIDVMMLFKFDIKYVKLNFKVIASMEFSFDINLCLLCSQGAPWLATQIYKEKGMDVVWRECRPQTTYPDSDNCNPWTQLLNKINRLIVN